MNFNELMARMRELDQPVPEVQVAEEPNEGNEFSGALEKARAAGQDEFEVDGKKYKVKEDGSVEECPMSSAPMSSEATPNTPPPSMSVNINAQGMDDIGELMKLLTKVNPDMINQKDAPMPPMGSEPSIASIAPSLPPLKMLPDLDAEQGPNDNKDLDKKEANPEGDEDDIMTHLNKELKPFDDEQAKDDEKKDKEEAFGNAPDGAAEPETKDIDHMVNKLAGGLNRPKGQYKHSYRAGDNPMAMPEGDLRAAIRAELLQRLAEAKGAK